MAGRTPCLVHPGVGLLDEAVAILVARILERRGIGARSEQPDALSLSRILSLDTKNVVLICLCYLGNATSAQIGYAIRRVRRKASRALIVVSFLEMPLRSKHLINTAIWKWLRTHFTQL